MMQKIILTLLIFMAMPSTFAKDAIDESTESNIGEQNLEYLSHDNNTDILNDITQIQEAMNDFNTQIAIIKKVMYEAKANLNRQNYTIILQKSTEMIKLIDIYSEKLSNIKIRSFEGQSYRRQIKENLILAKEISNPTYSNEKYEELRQESIKKQKQLQDYILYLQIKLGLVDITNMLEQ